MLLHHILAAVPPEVGGLPTWAWNGLSVGGLVTTILVGLFTARLWTKRQVDELVKQHDREVKQLSTQHDREVEDLKSRYETHIKNTVELLTGRVDDARSRET